MRPLLTLLFALTALAAEDSKAKAGRKKKGANPSKK